MLFQIVILQTSFYVKHFFGMLDIDIFSHSIMQSNVSFLIARNSFVKKSCTSNFSLVALVHLVKLTILLQAQTKI